MTRSRKKSWRLVALVCGVAAVTGGGIAIMGLQSAVADEVAVSAVTASAHDGNVPANATDNNMSTRWSADGDGQWIQFALAAQQRVTGVSLAWYVGDTRSTTFDIDVSVNGTAWTRLGTNLRSSGTTLAQETYSVTPTDARYVKITGHGNNDAREWVRGWNSLAEADIQATTVPAPTTPVPTTPGGGSITHGEQLTRAMLGPQGTLTQRAGFTTTGPTVLNNVQINGGVTVNHDFTCTDCRIIGNPGGGSSSYTVKVISSNGQKFKCVRCEIITRTDITKGVVSYGNAGIWLERTLIRGGVDGYFGKPANGHYTVTGVTYGHVILESMITDIQRSSGSHSDAIQIDGGTGGVLVQRSKIESYNIPVGSDPLTTTADGSELASGGVILTQDSSNPSQISKVHLLDNWYDGGNYTVDASPPDGLRPTDVRVENGKWGLKHRFGALRSPHSVNNRWGATGSTTCNGGTVSVVDESPLSC